VAVGVGVSVGGGAGIVAASLMLARSGVPTDWPTEAEIQPIRPSAVSTTYHISVPLFLPMIRTVSSCSK